MNKQEMEMLKKEYKDDLKITKAIHLHDEVGYNYSNKYDISYKNIVVGSELASIEFVREYIRKVIANL